MAEMKKTRVTLTREEKIDILNVIMDKNNINHPEMYVKTMFLMGTIQAAGFGRNAGTVDALRFMADLYESEIPNAQDLAAAGVDPDVEPLDETNSNPGGKVF